MRGLTVTVGFTALCGALALTMGGCGGVVDKNTEADFHKAVGDTSIVVFPVFVRDSDHRYDAAEAAVIGAFLTENALAEVTVSDVEIPITSQWGRNQAKMFRDSIKDFAEHLEQNPVDADYAILPEYLFLGSGKVGGVHLYLLSAAGVPAYAFLTNSHHDEFNDVDPQNVADCTTLVLNMLRQDLVTDASASRAKTAPKIRPDSSLTVFPVWLAGAPAKNVGDALGAVLEQHKGMSDIWPCDLVFNRRTDAEFDDVARQFGEFVKSNPIETEYALYAEIDGEHHPPRVLEVRAVVVNKNGVVVWSDIQTPKDADFKRANASNPMTCCVLISNRLDKQLDRSGKIDELEGEDRMARLWREKSGSPGDRAWKELEQRQRMLKGARQSKTLAVYPVQLSKVIDEDAGRRLIELINERKFFKAESSSSRPLFDIAPDSNEQKRLWDLAKAFREHVRSSKPDVDYALMAEYTIRPSDRQVWTVHFVICDRAGDWVVVDFQNNHHDDFNRINPSSYDDCADLIVERLKHYLR